MKQNEALVLVGLAALLLVAHSRSRSRLAVAANAPVQVATGDPGISVTRAGFQMRSWDQWMKSAPRAVAAALEESSNPDEIVANLFRRLYPNAAWPPKEGTPAAEQWSKLVASVGRSLKRPFPGHLHVVS